MKIVLADLHWEGHHTPYVGLLSEYLLTQGHQVTFITDVEHQRLDELPDVEMFQVQPLTVPTSEADPSTSLFASLVEQKVRTQQIRTILDAAKESDTDLLHLLWFDRTLLPYMIATVLERDVGFPVVSTLHRDSFTGQPNGDIINWMTKQVSSTAIGSSLKSGSLDLLTVHAEGVQRRLVKRVGPVSKNNVRVVPAPTPELSTELSKTDARNELNLPQKQPILLFFGGLRYEKGPDILARALENVDCEVTVLFAGPAADYDISDVKSWIRVANDSVDIIGHIEFIPESKVDTYFVAADALLLPYRRQRGISGPMRRACMAGIPVIGNRNSDIGDIIQENNLGETFLDGSPTDLERAITVLVNSHKEYDLDKYAKSQHWKMAGEAFEQIYEEVFVTE